MLECIGLWICSQIAVYMDAETVPVANALSTPWDGEKWGCAVWWWHGLGSGDMPVEMPHQARVAGGWSCHGTALHCCTMLGAAQAEGHSRLA